MSDEKPNYKETLNLPLTDFPMRAGLVTNEPSRLQKWDESDLYAQIQKARSGAPKFILHDGPPFANGDVHMGTALNKLLKDLVIKSKTMAGFHAPYIPGWDCHGLPIEFKVVKESRGLSPAEIRRRSEAYAKKYIDIQRHSFRRLGVFGDWDHPYLTLDPAYEADVIRVFARFIERDLVYRSKRPVLWSYGAQTALAEAEVEYEDKISPAIFVEFSLVEGDLPGGDASFVIWTTTPWTLPANLAVAVHPDFDYLITEFAHEDGRTKRFVVTPELVESFGEKTGFRPVADAPQAKVKGRALEKMRVQHPFLDRTVPIILGQFVTTEVGTGAVHIAPGHGQDDYVAGQQNGLEILSPVDDSGHFTEEVGLPEFVGKHVFASNAGIIDLLKQKGALLGEEAYSHSYPHCWRSKTPIIFRAVEQFFIRIDALREQALTEIDAVTWLPHWGRNRIYGTVEARPDWCISRQRTWGVPLPVFTTPGGETLLDRELVLKVADIIESEGTNLWYEMDDAAWAERLGLPEGTTKCQDTLDVWIDSGSSHVAVLDRHPELHAPADLYLEATDQHRGWFQSSLLVSMAVRGGAPYKTVMTHGFVVDHETGKKHSKSAQQNEEEASATPGKIQKKAKEKPMAASHYYDNYGADIVRLWVSSVDWQTEVPFGEDLFKQIGEPYRRFRNTLRILLGNLHEFSVENDAVPDEHLTLLDRWILERLHHVTAECTAAYEAYDFRKVFIVLNQFCANDLSSLYIDITKDRLYCDRADSPRRRATQTAMARVFEGLVKLLAPILAFTADEAWEFSGKSGSIHLELFPTPDPKFAGTGDTELIEKLLRLRGVIQQEVDIARKEKIIGSSNEASVTLTLSAEDTDLALWLKDDEANREFFIVSELVLITGTGKTSASVERSPHAKCGRCWRQLPSVGTHADAPELCGRCHDALGG